MTAHGCAASRGCGKRSAIRPAIANRRATTDRVVTTSSVPIQAVGVSATKDERYSSPFAKLYAIEPPKKGPQLFGFREEFLRQYPQGVLAAHVLGGRDVDGIGRGGIEQSLNARLAGKPGYRRLMLDSRMRVIEVQTDIAQAPQHGQSVTLTLDTVIQLHVEAFTCAAPRRSAPATYAWKGGFSEAQGRELSPAVGATRLPPSGAGR